MCSAPSNSRWPQIQVKDIKATELLWFLQQPRELFAKEIHWMMQHLDACLSAHGDYF
jgi:hypothetical protein